MPGLVQAEATAVSALVTASGPPPADGPVARLVVEAASDPDDRVAGAAFAAEAVLEGFLCHHARSRLFDLPDPDMALLAGDLLYALGLDAVGRRGDIRSVELLAGLIARSSTLLAEGREDELVTLWAATSAALGAGRSGSPEDQSDLGIERAPDALQSLFQVIVGTPPSD